MQDPGRISLKTFKRVVFYHPHFMQPGGASTYVYEIAKRFHQAGLKIEIVTINTNKEYLSKLEKFATIKKIGSPLSSSFLFWLFFPCWCARAIWLAKKEKEPAIYFAQVFPANWWGFVHKGIFKKDCVVWMCQEPSAFIHSERWIAAVNSPVKRALLILLRPLLSLIDKWLAQKVDHIFVNSFFGKNYALSIYKNIPPEKIEVTYLGVDHALFKPDNSTKPPRNEIKQIITIGRLTKFKNVNQIISALAKLDPETRPQLAIIGEGEAKNELIKLVSDLNLTDHVFFHGILSQDQLREELNNSAALILASENEPFGLVAVEAMACGIPVIAVQNGGPAETVIDGVTGILIPTANPDTLATAIEKILSNSQEQFFKSNAIKRAAEFNWQTTARQTLNRFTMLWETT